MRAGPCFLGTGQGDFSAFWFMGMARGMGWPTASIHEAEIGLEPRADVYVVEREIWRAPLERWRARGARAFVWLDDAYHLFPDYQLAVNQLWAGIWDWFTVKLARVDGIICPNPTLAADYARYNRNVYYVPNYHFVDVGNRAEKRALTLGWAGSTYHLDSWRLTGLWDRIPVGWRLRIVGHRLVALAARGAEEVRELPYADYLREVSSWQVYLIPVSGPYDARRSWIKAVEANLAGTAWLAVGDATGIYRGVPGGVSMRGVSTERDLERALELALGQGREVAREWAERQHVRHHVREWEEVLYA